jgi:hypothetical protein
MSIALRSLATLLFVVSLVCGAGAMAHGVADHDAMAHVEAPHDHGAPICPDCGARAANAEMSCDAMLGHCGPAITGDGGLIAFVRVALSRDPNMHVDLMLLGAEPESDTPPPRS